MKKNLLILLLLQMILLSAQAQNKFSLTGKITDEQKNPIAQATVHLNLWNYCKLYVLKFEASDYSSGLIP